MATLTCESCLQEPATTLVTFSDMVEYRVCFRCAYQTGEAKLETLMPVL